MQTPVHIVIGVLIQNILFLVFPQNKILATTLTVICAFFSHFFIDAAAILTYHPPKRLKGDKFWLMYHFGVYICSGILLFFLISSYWLGIIAANLVDIYDWLILRPLNQKIENKKLLKNWGLHKIVDKLRFKLFFWAPDMSYSRYAAIPEILLYIISIVIVLLIYS